MVSIVCLVSYISYCRIFTHAFFPKSILTSDTLLNQSNDDTSTSSNSLPHPSSRPYPMLSIEDHCEMELLRSFGVAVHGHEEPTPTTTKKRASLPTGGVVQPTPFKKCRTATGPVPLVNINQTTSFAPTSSGSCFSKLKSEVNSVSELISQQKTFCSSAEFEAFVSSSGLDQPLFKENPPLEDSKFDEFTKAYNALAPNSRLSIVFHGTRKNNIPNILANGLDPQHRRRQAYGPGEYFSNNPGTYGSSQADACIVV